VGDLQAARQWAEKAAASGNADAQFVYYMATVSLPELNFVDQQGKVDMKRYKALAARPISEREDEMTAYDMLGKSAAQNFPEAMLAMAGFYADNVGEGNRARAIALLDKMDKKPPLFEDLRKRLANFDQLGPSLVTVRIFDDAVAAGRTAALAAAAEKDRTKKDCQQVVPLRTQRLGALEKPVWLPVAVPELQRAYLMSGNWNEIWTFDVCGAQTQVVLAFVADGLGGASVGAARQ
jgi:malonyl CoA-acyl carrier protein transacylase